MKKVIYFFACCMAAVIGCSDLENSKEQHSKAETSQELNGSINIDSLSFFDKFESLYPSFNLEIDTSVTYGGIYNKNIVIDTNNCSSFRLNRIFIGKIENLLAEVKSSDSKSNRYHLQSGTLKLWVCSLPIQIKENDKVFISAYVYNIMGFERVFGYPTIISKLQYK